MSSVTSLLIWLLCIAFCAPSTLRFNLLDELMRGPLVNLSGVIHWQSRNLLNCQTNLNILKEQQQLEKDTPSENLLFKYVLASRDRLVMSSLRVTELNIYPVKSCHGIGLQKMKVTEWGPEWDRRLMLVDADNAFVTARKYPRLLQVKTRLNPEGLLLSANGRTDLQISLHSTNTCAVIDAKVWRDKVSALRVSDSADQWFSVLLETPVRLIYMPEVSFRQVDRAYFDKNQRVGFADGFPFLLTHQSSLDELNQRLADPISMSRFRSNIVVAGGQPWAEDRWREIRIGSIFFQAVKPCSRCAMTTIDPTTLRTNREPLKTLSNYRRTELGVIFGQNLVNLKHGIIAVGDEVEIMS